MPFAFHRFMKHHHELHNTKLLATEFLLLTNYERHLKVLSRPNGMVGLFNKLEVQTRLTLSPQHIAFNSHILTFADQKLINTTPYFLRESCRLSFSLSSLSSTAVVTTPTSGCSHLLTTPP